MMGQNGWFLTTFFSMNDKSSTINTGNHISFIQKTRNKLAVLQEMDFERNENKLRELLKDDRELFQFPIPLFLPMLLVWMFMIIFPLVLMFDPLNTSNVSINFNSLFAYYFPLLCTFFIFFLNQKYLVPSFVFKKKYAIYFVSNAVLLFVALLFREIAFFFLNRSPNEGIREFFDLYCFSFIKGHFGFNIVIILFVCCAWFII